MSDEPQGEDREVAAMIEACKDPVRDRLWIVWGLVGAFAAGGVVFVGVSQAGRMNAWGGGLLAVAVVSLLVLVWRRSRHERAERT